MSITLIPISILKQGDKLCSELKVSLDKKKDLAEHQNIMILKGLRGFSFYGWFPPEAPNNMISKEKLFSLLKSKFTGTEVETVYQREVAGLPVLFIKVEGPINEGISELFKIIFELREIVLLDREDSPQSVAVTYSFEETIMVPYGSNSDSSEGIAHFNKKMDEFIDRFFDDYKSAN